jgi:hypothetical protein
MIRPGFVIILILIILTACAPQPTATAAPSLPPTNTPLPTTTPTPIPPTVAFRLIDIRDGGFSLSVHPHLEFDVDNSSINLSDTRGNLIISLNGRAYIASNYTMESFLDKYVVEMASRGGMFDQSRPYETMIDNMKGTAVDISGFFLDDPIAGKAFVISPGKNFIVFGLGMSNLAANENEWVETGSNIFETLLASIKFKEEVKK